MKRMLALLGVGALSLLMGFSAAYAQDEPKTKEEPKQEEPKAEPKNDVKPPKHDAMKPPKQDENRPQAAQTPERGGGKTANGKSGHIPDDKFHANFGRQHTFASTAQPS